MEQNKIKGNEFLYLVCTQSNEIQVGNTQYWKGLTGSIQ